MELKQGYIPVRATLPTFCANGKLREVRLVRLPIVIFHLQWLKLSADEVKEQIYKLAKKGLTPSQIGKRMGCQ